MNSKNKNNDPAVNDANKQDSHLTEEIIPVTEAPEEENGQVTEDLEGKYEEWMEEVKKSWEKFSETVKKGVTWKGSQKAGAEEVQDEDGNPMPPAPSKDELQKQLRELKAEFTHTPMVMTPELEKLLKADIKAEGKKNKTRGAQMLGVLAKHNFYANGLTPEELRTTLEDLGPTYVKIGQIMSSRVDLLPESYCIELEKLRQNVKELDPAVVRAMIEAETGKKIEEIFSEFRRKREFFDAHSSFFAEMISGLEIDVVWRNLNFAGPALFNYFNELLSNINAELIVPSIFEPTGEFLCAITVGKLGIEFSLLSQTGIR